MHIPVLVCGIICGYKYGAISGFLVPFLSHLMTSMPPAPLFVAMMFEVAAYGLIIGLLYKRYNIFVSLIAAMLCGRLASAAANIVIFSVQGNEFGITAFLTGAFITALPGIIIQLVFIPSLVIFLEKTGYLKKRTD